MHRSLQFAASVLGMLAHTKACHIFPTLLADLVKNISSANKTHFAVFLSPPPDIKTTINPPVCQYPAFLYVGIGQQHKGQETT